MKTACSFVKDMKDVGFSSMFGKDLGLKTGVTCYWEQRNVSSSVVAVDINITQVVTRSLSAMIFSTTRGGIPRPTRLIHVEVLYPPSITSLAVDGQEVNGDYIINNGQKVNVLCFFEKGNPPAVFRLLVKNRTELISSHNQEYFHHLLTAQCEDDWPMIKCEGNGTQQNRSVIFLVRCPPQFVDVSNEIYTTSARNTITFPVKAHTTTFTACFLTSVSAKDITKRNVSCTLNGKPPYLNLRLHLDTETIPQGNWTLTLGNEIGSANATLSVLGSLTSAASPALMSEENVTTVLVCGCVVTVVIIAVVSVIVRSVRKQKHEVAVREGTSENLQRHSSIVNTDCCEPGNLSSETPENTSISAPEVREKKRLQNKDRKTYVAEATHTATNGAEMVSPHTDPEKKPCCSRNADGLIYGDLIFTNTSLSKVIIGIEKKTEYTDIKVTSPRLQTEC